MAHFPTNHSKPLHSHFHLHPYITEAGLGADCSVTPDCTQLTTNSECVGGKCACKSGFYDTNGEPVSGGNCNASE